MKPDQHKKKKSAQYRSKHGGSNNQANQSTAGNKNNVDNSKETKDIRQNFKDGKPKPSKSDQVSDSSEEEDVSTQQCVYERKTFQKRNIVSNWDKYEMPIEDETTDESKGADMTELLHITGRNVGSHFSLKDEKYWEREMQATDSSQYLSLDLEGLSASLSCIPMFKRLGIDESIFSESQIQTMNKEAEVNKQNYKPVKKEQLQIHDLSNQCISVTNTSKGDVDMSIVVPDKINCKTTNDPSTVPSIDRQEDDLELLLLLETSEPAINTDTHTSNQSTTGSAKENNSIPASAPGMENLEDWLDSVLDT